MNIPVKFHRAASRDLKKIADFTESEWGKVQARTYINLLVTEIERLADYPLIGSPITHVRGSYRKPNIGSHSVYYVVQQKDVRIMRILHERRDALRHL